jgi:hypothetical protein
MGVDTKVPREFFQGKPIDMDDEMDIVQKLVG